MIQTRLLKTLTETRCAARKHRRWLVWLYRTRSPGA